MAGCGPKVEAIVRTPHFRKSRCPHPHDPFCCQRLSRVQIVRRALSRIWCSLSRSW
jgi:hypothetical protein